MGKVLQPRQTQALLKPCPTIAHAASQSLIRRVGKYSTALYIAPMGGRLRWCATVAALGENGPIPLASLSRTEIREMETMASRMLDLEQPRGQSVGKGNHQLAPGVVAVNLYRELTDDEIALLPPDWAVQPTDAEIEAQQRRNGT